MKSWVIDLLTFIVAFTTGFGVIIPAFDNRRWIEYPITSVQAEPIPTGDDPNYFWNTSNDGIEPSHTINYPKVWKYLKNHITYYVMVRNNSGVWRDVTPHFQLGLIQRNESQKLTYDIDIPYAGNYYLNFTIDIPMVSYVLDKHNKTITIEYESDSNYFISYNFTDLFKLSNQFHFAYDINNTQFKFSIKRYVPGIVHLSLDPQITINAASATISTGSNYGRRMVRTTNGIIYVSYYTNKGAIAGTQIVMPQSMNNGTNWEPYKYQVTPNVTGKRNQTFPAIAIDSNDVVHLVWYGQVQNYNCQFIRYRRFFLANRSFSPQILNISRSLTISNGGPSIVIDAYNNVYLAWENTSTTTYARIYFKKRFASNGTWTPNFNLSHPAILASVRPSLAVTKDNIVHVMWYRSTTNFGLIWRKYWINNNTFSPINNVTNATTAGFAQNGIQITADSFNNIHAVFYQDLGAIKSINIRYKKYWASNNTWQTNIINLSREVSLDQYTPSLSIKENRDMVVLWHGTNNISTVAQIRCSNYTFSTNSWTNPANLTRKGGTTGANNYVNLMYALYPIINGVSSCSPKTGFSAFFRNASAATAQYLYKDDLAWPTIPRTNDSVFHWNTSFKHTAQNPVYVDDGFTPATDGWLIDKFPTIQEGCDAVANNGTVYVRDGNYVVNDYVIPRRMSIRANQSQVFVTAGGGSYILNVSYDYTNISGFNFTYTGADCSLAGIIVYASHCNISTNNFSMADDNCGASTGVDIERGHNNLLRNNLFHGSANYGVYMTDIGANKLTYENWFYYNNFSQNGFGIENAYASNNTIYSNRFTNNTVGVYLLSQLPGEEARENYVYNNYFGNPTNIVDENGLDHNFFNVSQVAGPNIIGGPFIGGNYYTNNTNPPIGNGFTTPYSIQLTDDYDLLPLTYNFNVVRANDSVFHWNTSFFSYAANESVYHWNVSWRNTANNRMIATFNVSFMNSAGFRTSFQWNMSFKNSSIFKHPFSWNVSFRNTSLNHMMFTWNMSFKNSSINKMLFAWNISYRNSTIYSLAMTWNVSFRNTSARMNYSIFHWNISFMNSSRYHMMYTFNVSFMNSSITYIFITNVYPANGSTGVMQQIMTSLNITHIKGWKMNITWYWDVLTPATIVYNHSYIMGNSSTSARLWNATNSYTTYYWHVDVNDGHGNYLNTTYHFITAANISGAGGVIGVIHDNRYWLLAVGLMLGIVVGMVIVVKKKKKNENQGDIGVF